MLAFLKLTGRLVLVSGIILVSGSLSVANRAMLASLLSSKPVVLAQQDELGAGLHRATFDKYDESLAHLGFATVPNAELFSFSSHLISLRPQQTALQLECPLKSRILRV